jgi:hypothetical protein
MKLAHGYLQVNKIDAPRIKDGTVFAKILSSMGLPFDDSEGTPDILRLRRVCDWVVSKGGPSVNPTSIMQGNVKQIDDLLWAFAFILEIQDLEYGGNHESHVCLFGLKLLFVFVSCFRKARN